MRRRCLPMLAITAATLGTTFASAASADIGGFATVMNGGEEVPGPGDVDAFGIATVIANSDTGQVCVRLRVFNIDTATAAHIHSGDDGVAGPVVIPLPAPSNGRSSGCVDADKGLIQRIIDDPDSFYVNVHNAAFPGGALRGQLP